MRRPFRRPSHVHAMFLNIQMLTHITIKHRKEISNSFKRLLFNNLILLHTIPDSHKKLLVPHYPLNQHIMAHKLIDILVKIFCHKELDGSQIRQSLPFRSKLMRIQRMLKGLKKLQLLWVIQVKLRSFF